MAELPAGSVMYGYPEECAKFSARHPLWEEMMANLVKALDVAFTRRQTMDSSGDRFVYFFGGVILEDFMEITLISNTATESLLRSSFAACTNLPSRWTISTSTRKKRIRSWTTT